MSRHHKPMKRLQGKLQRHNVEQETKWRLGEYGPNWFPSASRTGVYHLVPARYHRRFRPHNDERIDPPVPTYVKAPCSNYAVKESNVPFRSLCKTCLKEWNGFWQTVEAKAYAR